MERCPQQLNNDGGAFIKSNAIYEVRDAKLLVLAKGQMHRLAGARDGARGAAPGELAIARRQQWNSLAQPHLGRHASQQRAHAVLGLAAPSMATCGGDGS